MSADALELADLRHLAEMDLGVPTSLHDYQWDGVAFLFRSTGALLADEMGLGKTVQTVVALALLFQGRHPLIGRALIVAPASLTLNWQREIDRWAPSITVRRVAGDARSREAHYRLPIPVLVASYEHIRFDAFDRVPLDTFDLVVLDGAQRIKNSDSVTAFACCLLPRSRTWALSATPLENDEEDVVSILKFLAPSIRNRLPRRQMRAELEARMLRRRKADVRAELPPVILRDLELELSAPQRDAHDELWFERASIARDSGSENPGTVLLTLITRLKILCNFDRVSEASSKLDALRAFLEGVGENTWVLIFSQFVKTLEWISARLTVPHEMLTGSMLIEARGEAIAALREGATPRALLISLRAGGVGLNLGDVTHVVLVDRWWNPAVETQAIYRAHRFDREAPLHVVRFLVQDTIEERIAHVLEHKRQLFEQVVESVDSASYHFTRGELLQILELDPEDLPRALGKRR